MLQTPVRLPRHLLVLDFALLAFDGVLHMSGGVLNSVVFINTGLYNLLLGVVLPCLLPFMANVMSVYRDSLLATMQALGMGLQEWTSKMAALLQHAKGRHLTL